MRNGGNTPDPEPMMLLRRLVQDRLSAELVVTLVPLVATLGALVLLPWGDWATGLFQSAGEQWALLSRTLLQMIAAPALRGPLV